MCGVVGGIGGATVVAEFTGEGRHGLGDSVHGGVFGGVASVEQSEGEGGFDALFVRKHFGGVCSGFMDFVWNCGGGIAVVGGVTETVAVVVV